MKPSYLIGIDEVGRGPIAGPVTLGAAIVAFKNKKEILAKFRGVKESKQLKAQRREDWLVKMKKERGLHFDFVVSSVSSKIIDTRGLAWAIKKALDDCLKKLEKIQRIKPTDCLVLLDGGLKAPARYLHQKTIIKGDEKEPIIALASIAAKVTRDTYMTKLSKEPAFAGYDFHIHKGYGTKAHYKKIRLHGPSVIHRRSFL